MSSCPAGHPSGDADYCEVCGIRMSGSTPTTSTTGLPPLCPECGDPITDRFCEMCGFDTMNPQRPRRAGPPGMPPPDPGWTSHSGWAGVPGWMAMVGADRDYYERVMATSGADPGDLQFPPYLPERQYPLTGQYVRIGRRSVGRGVRPEIDLSLPPEDPAVSHEHAVLLGKPDGSWTLVDLGSSNGTSINDTEGSVSAHIEVPLNDGDRIFVGAWTVITVRKG